MGRWLVRRPLELDAALERKCDCCRIFVVVDSNSAHSCRREYCASPVYSKAVERIIFVNWFFRRQRVRPDFHNSESTELFSRKSVLCTVDTHAAVFLCRNGLGNNDPAQRTFADCPWRPCVCLGDEQFRRVLDYSFGTAASLRSESFGCSRQDRARFC